MLNYDVNISALFTYLFHKDFSSDVRILPVATTVKDPNGPVSTLCMMN